MNLKHSIFSIVQDANVGLHLQNWYRYWTTFPYICKHLFAAVEDQKLHLLKTLCNSIVACTVLWAATDIGTVFLNAVLYWRFIANTHFCAQKLQQIWHWYCLYARILTKLYICLFKFVHTLFFQFWCDIAEDGHRHRWRNRGAAWA